MFLLKPQISSVNLMLLVLILPEMQEGTGEVKGPQRQMQNQC